MVNFQQLSKKMALMIVGVSYLIAIIVGIVIIDLLSPSIHQLLQLFLADLGATLCIYLMSMVVKNASLYDPYWSVFPFFLGIFWLIQYNNLAHITLRAILLSLAILIWGIRLTMNWTQGWKGFSHEDWRYSMFRKQHPQIFWLINLVGIQIAPTVWVFLGCLPMYFGFRANASPNIGLDIIAFIVCVAAVLLEKTADDQIAAFIRTRSDPQQIMDQKLWRYSRHPNYLGEISFWWGIFLFGISAAQLTALWTIIGAVSITGMFLGVSIPLIETNQKAKKPLYADYIKKTSRLILWIQSKK